jgi:hypothetical protein
MFWYNFEDTLNQQSKVEVIEIDHHTIRVCKQSEGPINHHYDYFNDDYFEDNLIDENKVTKL